MDIPVLVVGSLHLDVVVDAPHLPAVDETVVGTSVAYRFGGKGGNQAVAAARMGARVAMAGRIGDDQFARQILGVLDAEGVDSSQVVSAPGASGMSVAIVDGRGDYGAVIVSAANRDLRAEDVALPDGPCILVLQNEIPEAANLALAARAGRGVTLVVNAAPARPLPAAILDRTDILIVNRGEAAALAGAERAPLDPVAAAQALHRLGPRVVIVTLGADGLVLAPSGMSPDVRPAPRVRAISSHGAGDTFTGALVAELARGRSLDQAITFAQTAASLFVATHPDARSVLTEAAVRAALGQAPSP